MADLSSPRALTQGLCGRITAVLAALIAVLMAGVGGSAQAALTSLTVEPLPTLSPVTKPNLMFILDDSGSMARTYMPDWVAAYSGDSRLQNSGFNSLYYDPAIRYRPPIKADSTSFPSMTSGNTDTWRKVPDDGFKVQSDDTSKLAGFATYHYYVPDQFCNAPDLKVCIATKKASDAYPHPAVLRWCKLGLVDCRATRVDGSYDRPRTPSEFYEISIVANRSYVDKSTGKKALARTDCAGADSCTYDEEMTNFANWWAYYRTRMQMAKSAVSLAFADVNDKFRLGYMSLNNNTGSDFLDVLDATTVANGHKSKWYAKLLAAYPRNGTPLRQALSTAGRYFAGKQLKINGQDGKDPMQYACQRNYTLLSTDGYWNDDEDPRQIDTSLKIGDQDGNASVTQPPYLDALAIPNTLADVAQYFYVTDIRNDAKFKNAKGVLGTDVASDDVDDKQQRMYTSTIGLGASGTLLYRPDYNSANTKTGDYADIVNKKLSWPKPVEDTLTAIDDLWHAAVNGRGTYYSAANPDDLRGGVQAFIREVSEGSGTSVANSAVSNPNLSEEDHLSFTPSYATGTWSGDLVAREINLLTGEDAEVAMWSQSNAEAMTSGKTVPHLEGRAYDSRLIYTANPAIVKGKPVLFKWDDAAFTDKMKLLFDETTLRSLTQYCTSGAGCLPDRSRKNADPAGQGTGVGGVNLVNFLRGDKLNEGKDSSGHYRVRSRRMGDIVDAQPVYVRKPLFNYLDKDYAEFRNTNIKRQAMVYAPANDGMVHAFKADSGEEAWAYIPSILLPKLYKLADKDYAEKHQYYINATPQHGDILAPDGKWRTILVGGFGQGARGYYALDVTQADKPPTVLWEFTHDSALGAGYTVDADMGFAFGEPVITKLSDGTWVVIVASGYNNVVPGTGRGFVWILDAYTGAVLHKIDTGKGTLDGKPTLPPGCAAAPCPSGLAHLRGYADSGNTNNQTSRVYGGDLLGNLWRIDISGLTKAQDKKAKAQLLTTLTDLVGKPQPVTSAPELGNVKGRTVVFVGTGRYLGEADIGSTDMQSFYAIKDTLAVGDVGTEPVLAATPRGKPCPTAAAPEKGCFMQTFYLDINDKSGNAEAKTLATYPMDFVKLDGWFIDLQKQLGERVNNRPELQRGEIVFISILPGKSAACSVGGESFENKLDYATGLNVPGVTVAKRPIKAKRGSSIASGPRIISLPGNKLVTRTNLGASPPGPSPKGVSTRRISWRELITD
jgi:type IV pilus assembly protein PilY1